MVTIPGASTMRAAAESNSAPYVDSQAIKERFSSVTAEDMEMLRSKKIIISSASFGRNMTQGLQRLAKENKMYDWPMPFNWYRGINWRDDKNKYSVSSPAQIDIPADVFSKINFVHMSGLPAFDVDYLMRSEPYHFGTTLDAAWGFLDQPYVSFEDYSKIMDAMQADFPDVRVIYSTAGFMTASRKEHNERCHAFNEKVRQRYMGKAVLYDMAKIMSDDFRCGHAQCPEYSNDSAGVHPNLPPGEIALAKGFILIMRDAFRSPTCQVGKKEVVTRGRWGDRSLCYG